MKTSQTEIKIDIREVVFSNEEGKSFCDIFIYEPENIEEQSLGSLYILGEVVNLSNNSSYLINLLASIAKKEFYSDTKRSTTESIEASLHKINSTLSDMASQGNIDWIGNLNMIISAYKKDELHISQTGEIKTLLIRDEQVTDIGKSIITESSSHHIRTFVNIASGELEIGDLVILATPELFNVFSTEKLKQMASSLEIAELAEAIQEAVEKEKDVNTMGLLILKVGEKKAAEFAHSEIKLPMEVETEEAIPVMQYEIEENIVEIEEEKIPESELILPTEIEEELYVKEEEKDEDEEDLGEESSVKESRISLEDIIKEYESEENNQSVDIKKKESAIDKKYTKAKFLDNISVSEKKKEHEESDEFLEDLEEDNNLSLLDNISNKLKSIVTKEKLSYILSLTKKYLLSFKNSIKGDSLAMESTQKVYLLSKNKSIILATFILIFALLAGGLFMENQKKIEEENLSSYSLLIAKAEEKINAAEIESIISPSDARKYLMQAKEMIKGRDISLSGETYQDLNNQANVLFNKIQNQIDILDLVGKIENPTVALDLNQFADFKGATKIFENNDEYFILGQSNQSFSEMNFSENSLRKLEVRNIENIENSNISSFMKKTDEIIFLKNKNELEILNISKQIVTSENVKFPEIISNSKDVDTYSDYLYFLSPDSNQIYKYKRLSKGFDDGVKWLKDEVDISSAVSMTIDGSIYLLNMDGSIEKFRSGARESSFSTEVPSIPIPASARISTNSNLKYLYAIDSENNRIVLFDKTNGKLVKQYRSEKFEDIKNIVISDKEDSLYLLNGDNVYKIDIKI